MKTENGRPSKLGSMYFERNEEYSISIRKFCLGYCKCGKKFGLTSGDLREFAQNMPGFMPDLVERLFRLRIMLPK